MKTITRMMLTLSLVAGGCQPREKTAAPDPNVEIAALPRVDSGGLPDGVLVSVNGQQLTADAAELELKFRMGSVSNQVPADRMADVRRQLLGAVAEQFIMRTLLLEEADRRQITVTPDDETRAYAKIQSKLPPGMTIDRAIKESPLGEKRMREEVRTGIRIDKLLAEYATNAVNVTDADIAEYMENNKGRISLPESVRARHILVSVSTNATEVMSQAAKAKAESLREQLIGGADFAELAAKSSDCPSKQRGGDLGVFARGQMVKPFEEAAFAQKAGEIGPVVETEFGYHIIRVDEHREAGLMPREQVRKLLAGRKKQDVLVDLIRSLKANAEIRYSGAIQPITPPPLSGI